METRNLTRYPERPGYKTEQPETSQKAAQAVTSRAATLREQCLDQLKKAELTADECAERLGEDKLSIRPRFSELCALNKIEDSGKRRLNTSGKSAAVWKLKAMIQSQLFE